MKNGIAAIVGALALAAFSAPPPTPPDVNVIDVNPGAISERDLCLTIAVGHSAVSECGDLRVVHELPSARTLNQERTPALIYNSAYGEPFPTVRANVTLPDGTAGLTRVVAVLKVNGLTRAQSVYKGSSWPTAQPTRIALGFNASMETSGTFRYTLDVTAYYGTTSSTRSVSGDLVIVNRKQSPFGAGWWLAGLDQLVLDQSGNPSLWIGGDGSVRRYVASGANWVAPSVDAPDTLKRDGSGYARLLSGGVKVRFDSLGRHIATRNRLGYETSFGYDVSGRLISIRLPSVDSSMFLRDCLFQCAPRRKVQSPAYAFQYAASGKLQTIVAPGADTSRFLAVYGNGTHVDSIKGPDTTRVAFGYLNPGSGRMVWRRDRALNTTRYRYDRANKISSAKLEMAAGDSIVTRLIAAESRGTVDSSGAGAVDASLAYTQLDGPRLDVGDTTNFWLNRYGAPTRIRDALGSETTIERSDSRFPALVTHVRYANGRAMGAVYDNRGNAITTTDSSTYRDDSGGRTYATTIYAWDSKWDEVTQVTSPEGVVTSMAYDTLNGNRLWQQLGTNSTRRVIFGYSSKGLLESITEPTVARPDSILYDSFGNPRLQTNALGIQTHIYNDAVGRPGRVAAPIDSTDTVFVETLINYDQFDRPLQTLTRAPSNTVPHEMDTTANGDPVRPQLPAGVTTLNVENIYGPEGTLLTVKRQSIPDPGNIGYITTQFVYDAALRRVREIAADGAVDSTFYDPAGNAREVHTRRTDPNAGTRIVVRMEYDPLNRLTRRILPSVHYPSRMEGMPTHGELTGYSGGRDPFPQYPNDGASGYRIDGDTANFGYDQLGNTILADNRDAQVRRAYNVNGSLRADTLRIRTTASIQSGGSFESHVYGLEYFYDLDGRRTKLKHPGNIAPVVAGFVKDSTSYSYQAITGELVSVRDPLGNLFSFSYDERENLSSITRPGFVSENFSYDAPGRLRTDRVLDGSSSPYRYGTPGNDLIRNATSNYDVRDKHIKTTNLLGTKDTVTASYSALGHLASAFTISHDPPGVATYGRAQLSEDVTDDALGNQTVTSSTSTYDGPRLGGTSPPASSGALYYRYEYGTGRLKGTNTNSGVTDTLKYDGAGNEIFRAQGATSSQNGYLRDRASYYAADGTLRAADARYFSDLSGAVTPFFTRSFDEYRYDALGRRIWVRSRRWCEHDPDSFNDECQLSKLRRTVWDGDEELYEIQVPGSDSSTYLETDTDLPQLPATPRVWEQYTFDPNRYFGRVVYTHATGVDEPLGITRMGYGDAMNSRGQVVPYRAVGPFTLSPLWNERGQPYMGTFDDGGARKCQSPSGVGADTVLRCVEIFWPEGWVAYTRPDFRPTFWHGTLLEDKRDHSGTLYRRNRYYDPEKGRFTQEDPIGLAGGMNLYGFAGGDPINFSDPFGLCPDACFVESGVGAVVLVGIGATATIIALANGDDFGNALSAGVSASKAAIGSIFAFARNRRIGKALQGEANVISEHFGKLSNPGDPGGDDPRNRDKWKKDIRRHIDEMKKKIEDLKGDRNKQPWEEKVRRIEDKLRQTR